jgi:spore coat protein CotH
VSNEMRRSAATLMCVGLLSWAATGLALEAPRTSAAATASVSKPTIGDRVFDDDVVHSYSLELAPEELAKLQDYGALARGYQVRPAWVTARLRFEGQVLERIAMRFRGDQSIWDCVANGQRKTGVSYPQFGFGSTDICAKFSLKLDFDRLDSNQRLDGLKALNLRSMSKDPTKMRERLGLAMFRDMGLVAPRAAHARLFVNGAYWGLFLAVEQIDGRFTTTHFPEAGDGNLYKETWPDATFTDQRILAGLQTNRPGPEPGAKPPDLSRFQAFRDAVVADTTDAASFREKVAPFVDLQQFARYMAVDRGILNFDGVIACYDFGAGIRHNFYWYQDPRSGRFVLIPWDLDLVFVYPEPNYWTNNAPRDRNVVPNWNVVNKDYRSLLGYFDPGSAAVARGMGYPLRPIDKDKFLRLARDATWQEFGLAAQELLDRHLTPERVAARLSRWRKQIGGAVAEDPTLVAADWSAAVDALARSVPDLRLNLQLMKEKRILRE